MNMKFQPGDEPHNRSTNRWQPAQPALSQDGWPNVPAPRKTNRLHVLVLVAVFAVGAASGGAAIAKFYGDVAARSQALEAKARAFDHHCDLVRFTIHGIRRDLDRPGADPDVGLLQYQELARRDFESVEQCMLTSTPDPLFFPEPCDYAHDKVCVRNQLNIFMAVMR